MQKLVLQQHLISEKKKIRFTSIIFVKPFKILNYQLLLREKKPQ